jgi:hypothetical protein
MSAHSRSSTIAKRVATSFNDAKYSDVRVTAGEATFHCHMLFLAQLPAFARKLDGVAASSNGVRSLHLGDYLSAKNAEILLRALYGEEPKALPLDAAFALLRETRNLGCWEMLSGALEILKSPMTGMIHPRQDLGVLLGYHVSLERQVCSETKLELDAQLAIPAASAAEAFAGIEMVTTYVEMCVESQEEKLRTVIATFLGLSKLGIAEKDAKILVSTLSPSQLSTEAYRLLMSVDVEVHPCLASYALRQARLREHAESLVGKPIRTTELVRAPQCMREEGQSRCADGGTIELFGVALCDRHGKELLVGGSIFGRCGCKAGLRDRVGRSGGAACVRCVDADQAV